LPGLFAASRTARPHASFYYHSFCGPAHLQHITPDRLVNDFLAVTIGVKELHPTQSKNVRQKNIAQS